MTYWSGSSWSFFEGERGKACSMVWLLPKLVRTKMDGVASYWTLRKRDLELWEWHFFSESPTSPCYFPHRDVSDDKYVCTTPGGWKGLSPQGKRSILRDMFGCNNLKWHDYSVARLRVWDGCTFHSTSRIKNHPKYKESQSSIISFPSGSDTFWLVVCWYWRHSRWIFLLST